MAKHNKAGRFTEIFCVGGKLTIELFAPFASRVIATEITPNGEELPYGFPWLPEHIKIEQPSQYQKGGWSIWSRKSLNFQEMQVRIVDVRRHLPIEF